MRFCYFSVKKGVTGCKKLQASATLEATLIMPVIMSVILIFVWMIDIYRIHAEIETELYKIGTSLVAYSNAGTLVGVDKDTKNELLVDLGKIAYTEGYVKSGLKKLDCTKRVKKLTTLLSDFNNSDYIDIKVSYYVAPYITMPGIKGIYVANRFHARMFVGYKCPDRTEEEMVYVTRTGKVYHSSPDCKALQCKPDKVLKSKVDRKRNESGAIYYPCEVCENEPSGSYVYITPYGARYHNKAGCRELKLDVYKVYLSLVGNRRKCKLCY